MFAELNTIEYEQKEEIQIIGVPDKTIILKYEDGPTLFVYADPDSDEPTDIIDLPTEDGGFWDS